MFLIQKWKQFHSLYIKVSWQFCGDGDDNGACRKFYYERRWEGQRPEKLTKAKTFLVRFGNTGGFRGDFQLLVSSLRCLSSPGNITYKWSIASGVFFLEFSNLSTQGIGCVCCAFRRSPSDNNFSWDNFTFFAPGVSSGTLATRASRTQFGSRWCRWEPISYCFQW